MQSFGLIGNPVAQSISPPLHRMIYDATGFEANYSSYLVEKSEVSNVVAAMKTLGISGINVTSPFKQDIMPHLDELSQEACEIGAVNTVHLRENGTTIGHNTDCYGFAESLLISGFEIMGKRFAVCGTSGAGKAACWALKKYGADKVVAVSTNAENGVTYAELERMTGLDTIVNCTPLGMAEQAEQSPVKPQIFANFTSAVDMIYNPHETVFLSDARLAGLKTLNGLPMLVMQGVRSFTIWTGIKLEIDTEKEIIAKLACILQKKHVY